MNTAHEPEYNVLLVDDNPQNLAALSRMLAEHGYHIRTAINGQVALKSVQTMAPDLILLDIRMPGLDGYEVCQQLKADPATREIPVLFLSALDAPLDKVRAFEVGGVDYILKPFHADEVVARVATHLTLRAIQQRLHEQNLELQHYRAHLEELVAARTVELTHANAALHHEIVARARMTEALQLSEQQYRILAEHVKHGIVIAQAGRIVFANAALSAMVGRSKADLEQLEVPRLFSPAMQTSAVERLCNQPAANDEQVWQVELSAPNGQTVWTEIEQSPLIWNDAPARLLTITDVHECKLRELHLEQERARLEQENLTFKSSLTERYRFGELIGKSPAMQRVYEMIVSAAASDVNVLIVGESGTGKELIARTLHQVSARQAQPFVPINCASIPDTLFEREFFGHTRGAFTGANRDKPGLFDRAHRGVLFLDEVTELSPANQAKLLRVLQDGEYLPLGSNTPKKADVLLVAATNKDWRPLIKQRVLREDFFYRVCVIELRVPPLRDRKDDLPLLIQHFLEQYQQKQRKLQPHAATRAPMTLPGAILTALYAYDWPGNVRELQNALQRYLATQHLDPELSLLVSAQQPRAEITHSHLFEGLPLAEAVKAFEKQLIYDALAKNQQHKINTAKMLGIPRSTLHRKIKEFQLPDDHA